MRKLLILFCLIGGTASAQVSPVLSLETDPALLDVVCRACAHFHPDALDADSPYTLDRATCGTMAILGLRSNWDKLSPATKSTFSSLFQASRPSRTTTVTSPSGHFAVHYNTTGIHAVSLTDIDGNGTPDYVDETINAFEDSWTREIDELGYNPPPSDGDGVYDIYITSLGSQRVYGLTWPLGSDLTTESYIEVDNNFTDANVYYTQGIDGLKVTAAHEFFHAIQFGYYADFGKLEQMAKALTEGFVFQGEYNHYRNAHYGSSSAGLDASKFLAYSQTHDQVGNRAFGERLGHLINERLQKLCAAMTLLSPFVPMLFQGEEWSASSPFLYFTNHPDPKLGRAIQRGRQREFKAFFNQDRKVPNPQSKTTFNRSKLNWLELEQDRHLSMRKWYTQLISLRKDHEDLRTAGFSKLSVTFDEQEQWLKLTRGAVVAVFNFAQTPLSIPVMESSGHRLALTSDETNSPSLINGQAVNIYTQ